MKTFIIIFALASLAFAQEDDPLGYFPYKTGNMWEYYFDDLEYPDTVQVFNIKDSVDAEGNIYLTQFARRIHPMEYPLLFLDTTIYKIDTSFNVFAPSWYGGGPFITEDFILYKLNAKKGDQWVIYDYSQIGGNGYEIARVIDVWEDELFFGSGINTTFKAFTYYYSEDSTDTLGLVRYGDNLAYGFGLWSRGGGDLIGDVILKGCVINDTLYGDTTDIITSVKDLSENFPVQFELYQNYPNPFNPLTTISFDLFSLSNISLIIYDILGKEIFRLIGNKELNAGEYKVVWDGIKEDGSKAASGIYFYRLITENQVLSRSMILLK